MQPRDDAEAREKALAEERARADAEAQRLKEEKFQQDKADVLKSMKGASSGRLQLKGIGDEGSQYESADSLSLKPVGGETNVLSEREVEQTYWRTVSIPDACFVASKLTATNACGLLAADELWKALQGPDPVHVFAKLLLKNSTKKFIVIGLGGDKATDSAVDLVEAMYKAETKVFDHICQRISKEMALDPVKRAWLIQYAKLDSEAVERLRKQIASQEMNNIEGSQDYLQRNPGTPGIRLNCTPACAQLLKAANGVGAMQ